MKITIKLETDIVRAVQYAMMAAEETGFNRTRQFMIATAVSELARNIVIHAGTGVIHINNAAKNENRGIEIIAEDKGLGIANIDLAMQDYYSTAKSLGIGLPGTRRLMDEFEIESEVNEGTTVTVRKWL